MQNMYVGDIGDYGKYGLLRAIFSDYRLGIVWYLVPNEKHKTDGKYIDYLSKPGYRRHDEELFKKLRTIVDSGKRHVSEIEKSGIFHSNTIYFNQELTYDGIDANSEEGRSRRILLRERWLEAALKKTKDCRAIFLDPDNGIETPSVKRYSKASPKYVCFDEIAKFASRKQIVVVYHHLGRNGTHEFQISQRALQLKSNLNCSDRIISLRFKSYSPRAYFIITNDQMYQPLEFKINKFLQSSWKQCFELAGQ